MLKKTVMAGVVAAAFLPGFVAAQQSPAPPSPPPAVEKPAESAPLSIFGLDVTGYADLSYNHLNRSNLFTSGAPSRVFDLNRNGFTIQQLAVTVAKQPKEGLGGLLNVIVGKDADVIASYKTAPQKGKLCNVVTGFNADGSTCNRDHIDVTQAFLQYATGPWTLMGGKYVTLAGAEVINTPTNTNFSRSILFGYAIPFTHTGLRASYALSDTLTLIGGVTNGWDDIKDTNGSKTAELGVSWSPSKMISLGVQAYLGKERAAGLTRNELPVPFQAEGQRNLLDAVLTINATDKLTFVLNYDNASQANTAFVTPTAASKSKWDGFAGYANYQFTDQWRLSARGEYFNDKQGYRTGVVQKWKEATLTLSWLPVKEIELRGEARRDRSNVASFVDSNGVTAHNAMTSYGLQFLYKF